MKYLKMLGLMAIAATALMAVAASASATTLEVGGVVQNKAVTLTASLATGSSAILKDEFGTTTDTCTTSEVEGTTEKDKPLEGSATAGFTGHYVGGAINTLTFKNCTHTTTVLNKGELWVTWESGTNGFVSSTNAEVTVQSTFFGASAVCKTGSGTSLGTLTGVSSGHATMHINAKINCGILGSSSWTGTYTVTSPTGLGVVN